MPEILVRPGVRSDLARLTEIYNYYVVNTPVTFDVEPYTASGLVRAVRDIGTPSFAGSGERCAGAGVCRDYEVSS
jgi:L-amino acid N-acyltransferase YncA